MTARQTATNPWHPLPCQDHHGKQMQLDLLEAIHQCRFPRQICISGLVRGENTLPWVLSSNAGFCGSFSSLIMYFRKMPGWCLGGSERKHKIRKKCSSFLGPDPLSLPVISLAVDDSYCLARMGLISGCINENRLCLMTQISWPRSHSGNYMLGSKISRVIFKWIKTFFTFCPQWLTKGFFTSFTHIHAYAVWNNQVILSGWHFWLRHPT